MVHFRSRGIGLEQCIQLMKNSRNGTIWFHGEREKNTKLFFYHYKVDRNKDLFDKAVNEIKAEKSASWWIDNNNRETLSIIMDKINK